jgi:hypothetical protein
MMILILIHSLPVEEATLFHLIQTCAVGRLFSPSICKIILYYCIQYKQWHINEFHSRTYLHHNIYSIHIFIFISATIFNIVNVTQITLSKGKPHLSLCEVYCFHASWTEPFFNHLMHFMLPKRVCILLKLNFNACVASVV